MRTHPILRDIHTLSGFDTHEPMVRVGTPEASGAPPGTAAGDVPPRPPHLAVRRRLSRDPLEAAPDVPCCASSALVGCGEPYDVFGGGELSVTFSGAGARGFTGTATVAGTPDAKSLAVHACERDGFTSSMWAFLDDPVTRRLQACGEESGTDPLTEAEAEVTFRLGFYGDWLSGTALSDAGAGGARDGASLWLFSPESDTDTSFWGSWQADSVEVALNEVSGTMSGTMDFLEEASVTDTGVLDFTPATWSQAVTVTWSFDSSIRRRESWTQGSRADGAFQSGGL